MTLLNNVENKIAMKKLRIIYYSAYKSEKYSHYARSANIISNIKIENGARFLYTAFFFIYEEVISQIDVPTEK